MPVILDPEQFDKWLNPEVHEAEQIGAMLKPCPADLMECAKVSTLVNKPANNRAEVLEPLPASS